MRKIISVCAVVLSASMPVLAATILGPVLWPPGGGAVLQSGDDETIGMDGGITFSYSGFVPAEYAAAYWGPAGANTVQFALDGAIDEPGETLDFDPGQSNLGAGLAVWTGSTDLSYFPIPASAPVTVSVDLRMELRPTASGSPIPMITGGSVGRFDLDVLVPVPGDFDANLVILAYFGGIWEPAVDLYNRLHTTGEDVRIEVATAFFYEPLEVPDPLILELLANVESLEAKLDTPDPRIDEILVALGHIVGRLDSMQGQLNDLGNIAQDTQGRVQSLEQTTGDLVWMNESLEAKLDDGFGRLEGLQEMIQMALEMTAEEALLGQRRLARIYLPMENGGLLEMMREVVQGRIQQVIDSDESPNSAQLYMTLGDREKDFGRYKRAYNYYSRAYCEAVKIVGEPCPQ